ncbi:hypothetical protein [Psychrobacter sp. 72-O-c]|uniref:hypothetical protein n=1 Tax=Psychrobacter sp. 72-O-c TaxID=2774125 RepID=UPI001918B2FC|nr:hypothetical protein [Psychrobacter sp. 72-O-c]
MIVIFNVLSMIIAALMLTWMLMRTRCYDSVGWWAFRVLACYALVCFVYLAYDTSVIGSALPTRYMFIRFGCLALVAAMFLSWHLLGKDGKKTRDRYFNDRLQNIFKRGD